MSEIWATFQRADVVCVLFGASVLILFLMAASNRVVVFSNIGDLVWTAGVLLIPLVTFGAVWLFASGPLPTNFGLEFARQEPAAALAAGIGAVLWLVAVGLTVSTSIRENGLALGTLVALFKLLASAFFLIALPGALYVRALFGDERRRHDSPVRKLILGAFAGIGYLLINGGRVAERRYERGLA
jgi:hypothetical protein